MSEDRSADCLVCRKHREQGPLVPGGPVAGDEIGALVGELREYLGE
jgi:hypothetical protein